MPTALKNLLETSSDPDHKAWADSIRAKAQRWVDNTKGEDAESRKSAREDASDLKKIARMIESGKLDKAKSAIAVLDSVVRDEIPNTVWTGLGMSDY